MNVLEATRRYMGLKHELEPKFQKLRDLKLFVLDNSIRESTVGALRGHTLENKFDIFNQTKKLSFQHNIVGAFSRMRRVDDKFVEDIVASGEDMTNKYAFSEFYDWDFKKNRPADTIPVGLLKCKELKIPNVIMEVDLANLPEDTEFGHAARCKLFEERFAWIKENLTHDKRILINLRDLPTAIIKCTTRAFQTIEFLSKYRPQIFAIITEEPSGKYFPEELGNMSKACTEMMHSHGYTGHFLVHVHQQWGMHNAGVLECLANGATGIWCSVSEVGAAMGHASSILTIMNLIRLGNNYVEQTYNCKHLREAAQVITQVVTGGKAHPMTPVYGARALDQVFGAGGMGSGDKVFDLAGFFDEEVPMRITTLASEQMIVTRLTRLFGKHPTFTLSMANKMKKQMLEDHRHNRKEEYHSPVGLATLFDKAGGVKTQAMLDVLAEWEGSSLHIKGLLDEIHETWTEWDVKDHVQDDKMSFRNFYDGFLQQYFGCYTCPENEKAITAVMNVDDDHCSISWDEFSIFLKWAGKEYPKTETAEELLEIAFSKGIIPSMQEELKKASS